MSITFSTTPSAPVKNWEVKFWCDKDTMVATSDVEAKNIAINHLCDECKAYQGPLLDEVKVINDVQMSNSNALNVMSLLGMNLDYCGEINANDFNNLVTQLQSANLESVYSSETSQYLRMKLNSLETLSNWAVNNSASINWG